MTAQSDERYIVFVYIYIYIQPQIQKYTYIHAYIYIYVYEYKIYHWERFITIRAIIHIITFSIDELQKEMNRIAPIVLFVKENANAIEAQSEERYIVFVYIYIYIQPLIHKYT